MTEFDGIKIPNELLGCRKVWVYQENKIWVLSSRAHKFAEFKSEAEAIKWWQNFENLRKLGHRKPTKSRPPKKTNRGTPRNIRNTRRTGASAVVTPKNIRQNPATIKMVLGKINQGAYDSEASLLRLIKKAEKNHDQTILKAAQQRLKLVSPNMYRKLIGPLRIRDPLGSKNCYCANPASLKQIADDIINENISTESLLCDACWDIDISAAWGFYGWVAKIIDRETWQRLCEKRGDTKFATY